MKKNILILILLCGNLYLALLLVRPAWLRLGSSEQKLTSDLELLNRENRQLRSKVETLTGQLAATNLRSGSKTNANPATAGNDPISAGLDFLENPKTQRLAMAALKSNQWTQYGALFSAVHLSPHNLSTLRELLAERDASVFEATSLSEKAGVPLDKAQLAEINAIFEKSARDLIGPAGLALAEAPVTHPVTWHELSDLQSRMLAMGLQPMNQEQMSTALTAISSNLQFLPHVTDVNSLTNFFTSKEEHNAAVITQLTPVLSPGQLSVVKQKLSDNITTSRLFYYQRVQSASSRTLAVQAPAGGR